MKSAFTLIELLVVIAIIAVLAGLSLPIIQNVQLKAQMADAMNDARNIGLALQSYAGDHEGRFPRRENRLGEPIESSNDAFRDLVPRYLDDEEVFAVGRSLAGPSADNQVDTPEQILEPGENHFAYVEGLLSSSHSRYPLVVDSTDGSGHYVDDETAAGGTWRGTKAVMITVGMSAQLVPLAGAEDALFIPRFNDPTANALAVEEYIGSGVRLLEPAMAE